MEETRYLGSDVHGEQCCQPVARSDRLVIRLSATMIGAGLWKNFVALTHFWFLRMDPTTIKRTDRYVMRVFTGLAVFNNTHL